MSVMGGRLEDVTVRTLERARLVVDVEVEDVVDEVRVLSGDGRPRARRTRSLRAISIA